MVLKKTMQIAVIGLGNFFRKTHAAMLKKLQKERLLNICWIADISEKNLEQASRIFPKAACFNTAGAVLEKVRPDAAVILVNGNAKPAIFSPFIKAGIPFFTEKPPAPTYVILRDFLLKHRKLPYHLVAWNRRYAPVIVMLKRFIEQRSNNLSLLCADFLRYDQASPPPGTGNLQHVIDTLRYLGGEIESMQCGNGAITMQEEDRPFSFSGVVRFASGVLGQFNFNVNAGIDKETYRAMATNEMAVAEMGFPNDSYKEYLQYKNRKTVKNLGFNGNYQRVNGIEAEYREFLKGLARGNKTSPTPLGDSLKTLKMCEMAGRLLR
ncbi:MAG: hypothetical protein A2487_15210 [Candidatus Raymondbacteria bacterium RifOxyC12_full_50_8]|uniref:Gfo/Idh/MocA-like oxidoreductase N-terminal domain-containing protein n=1 Tax=Candidatus Raymondbacteria bacterium RIFOXYD12_FULL_49_13 TaxID=1817890 RepID=A0A1F7FJR9_UNCRA|nr:MAG: hypothetical protein A2350_10600 [Candidatus Raymondbacteria bacterium RifOxyB12_full_50_8]OGJ91986.1 MAG: hypothetical protein A2248_09430 [Candidatus Raymondbacteria bacterium RIFOXYA2_FULL_49_16]OGJ96346.1 MAG: hypothetical protein A2453_08460 [Candidatus Raymondbacteria bacterium RIFOXYC2_FULL_50_21]OGK03719.1 MAG: hypothetical protein A2487_15210 [Candidatus Raymondbacteria bacterium RifOxyC12_full_50_8]OGK06883.1 MAG: hypothetical protein A2519_11530 [Candidatus Raymondbacteria ba